MGIRYLVPAQEADLEMVRMAPRLDSLDGAVIGLLDNGKPRARELLQHIADLLRQRYALGGIVWSHKVSPSNNCPPEQLDALVAQCDAVITAVGD